MPNLTHAFDTLDGDATKWPRAPRYSIGRLAADLAIHTAQCDPRIIQNLGERSRYGLTPR